jgi:hypothetical protein
MWRVYTPVLGCQARDRLRISSEKVNRSRYPSWQRFDRWSRIADTGTGCRRDQPMLGLEHTMSEFALMVLRRRLLDASVCRVLAEIAG